MIKVTKVCVGKAAMHVQSTNVDLYCTLESSSFLIGVGCRLGYDWVYIWKQLKTLKVNTLTLLLLWILTWATNCH